VRHSRTTHRVLVRRSALQISVRCSTPCFRLAEGEASGCDSFPPFDTLVQESDVNRVHRSVGFPESCSSVLRWNARSSEGGDTSVSHSLMRVFWRSRTKPNGDSPWRHSPALLTRASPAGATRGRRRSSRPTWGRAPTAQCPAQRFVTQALPSRRVELLQLNAFRKRWSRFRVASCRADTPSRAARSGSSCFQCNLRR
jgi:hypothetical protein